MIKKSFNSKNGVSIAEALVAIAIVGVITTAWFSNVANVRKSGQKGKADYELSTEQKAITGIVESIGKLAAKQTLCPRRHPYGAISAGFDCRDMSKDPPTNAEMDAWNDLAEEILKWPKIEPSPSEGQTIGLSKLYYTSNVHPKLGAAGCLLCHGANDSSGRPRTSVDRIKESDTKFPAYGLSYILKNRPDLYALNFDTYDGLIQPSTYLTKKSMPLATRVILSSRLGRMLLRNNFANDNVLEDSKAVQNRIVISSEVITYKMTPYFPYIIQTAPTATKGCKAAMLCSNTGDIYITGSCYDTCVQEKLNLCSCGKDCLAPCPLQPYVCIKFQPTYSCLSAQAVVPQLKSAIPGDAGGAYSVADSTPPVLMTVADATCTNVAASLGQAWCNSNKICSATDGTPNKQVPLCMQPSSGAHIGCQRQCDVPKHGPGHSCGKNCWVEGPIIGCSTQSYLFSCLAETTGTSDVMKYTVTSSAIDPLTKEKNEISTVGSIQ